MQRVPDPYRVLGLVPEATMVEVKAAHRRLAKRFHPDAPHADAARFLAVQDAYELLRDPLRRREWDRQHLPGPVRAAPTTGRRRGSANVEPPPASTGPAPRGRRGPLSPDPTFGPNDRPPQADTWTWTAEGVPWWEDGGGPRSRRSARRRPPAAPGQRPATADASERSEARGGVRPPAPPSDPPLRRRKTAAPAEPTTAEGRSEFDVFSRSSGAAWSSASRAYFRRRAADMPSGAASPNTPRWTTPVGAPPPRRYAAAPASPQPEPESEPEPEVGAQPRARRKASKAPSATTTATPTTDGAAAAAPQPAPGSAASAAPQPASAPPHGGGSASSRRLGAALAALIRRGHR